MCRMSPEVLGCRDGVYAARRLASNGGKHPLEVRARIVGMMPLAEVAVFTKNRDAVFFGVLPVAPDLFFGVLCVGGNPMIQKCRRHPRYVPLVKPFAPIIATF